MARRTKPSDIQRVVVVDVMGLGVGAATLFAMGANKPPLRDCLLGQSPRGSFFEFDRCLHNRPFMAFAAGFTSATACRHAVGKTTSKALSKNEHVAHLDSPMFHVKHFPRK
jgi:hypothetical protein